MADGVSKSPRSVSATVGDQAMRCQKPATKMMLGLCRLLSLFHEPPDGVNCRVSASS